MPQQSLSSAGLCVMLPTLVALVPFAALAQEAIWTCSFQTECLDDECAESGYQAELALTPSSIDAGIAKVTGKLTDDAETVPLAGTDQNGLLRLSNIENATGARLLTIGADGTARYTTHIPDPVMAMTYLGRCEDAT